MHIAISSRAQLSVQVCSMQINSVAYTDAALPCLLVRPDKKGDGSEGTITTMQARIDRSPSTTQLQGTIALRTISQPSTIFFNAWIIFVNRADTGASPGRPEEQLLLCIAQGF